MKPRLYLFLLVFFFCSSCSTSYYLCETSSDAEIFYRKSIYGQKSLSIPKNTKVIVQGNSKYRKIKYNDTIGWAYLPSFKTEKKYNYEGSFKITKRKKKKKSHSTYSGGTVHVKGYYRKDGTYVRPHTRKKGN